MIFLDEEDSQKSYFPVENRGINIFILCSLLGSSNLLKLMEITKSKEIIYVDYYSKSYINFRK